MSAFAERVLANVREGIRAEVAYALELAGEPELLEALKAARAELEEHRINLGEDGLRSTERGVFQLNARIDAAIAKTDAKP